MFLKGNFKKYDDLEKILNSAFSWNRNFFKKKKERPNLKFLNWTSMWPPLNVEYQAFSFPFPFPIRLPKNFFERGRCGKVKNQNFRRVLSVFFIPRFNINLNLKIFLLVKNKGFVVNKPVVPKLKKKLFLKNLNFLFFCNFFDLKVFGCNIKREAHL